MNVVTLRGAMDAVNRLMAANRDYLVELDQQNGDGDLGISMAAGFQAAGDYLAAAEEKDLGKLLMKCGGVFNEAAPSSLGTIISFGFMGMARALKGKEEAGAGELASAMEAALANIMEKAKSKPGEKTILDSLAPAIQALKAHAAEGGLPCTGRRPGPPRKVQRLPGTCGLFTAGPLTMGTRASVYWTAVPWWGSLYSRGWKNGPPETPAFRRFPLKGRFQKPAGFYGLSKICGTYLKYTKDKGQNLMVSKPRVFCPGQA